MEKLCSMPLFWVGDIVEYMSSEHTIKLVYTMPLTTKYKLKNIKEWVNQSDLKIIKHAPEYYKMYSDFKQQGVK